LLSGLAFGAVFMLGMNLFNEGGGSNGGTTYEIRPLTVGQILYTAFSITRERFALLVGIWAVLYVPYTLVTTLTLAPAPGDPFDPTARELLVSLGNSVLSTILHIVAVKAVVDVYVGRRNSIWSAYASSRGLLIPALGTLLLPFVLLGALLGVLVFLAGPMGALLLLVVPVVYLFIVLWLLGPVVVVERKFWMRAIDRCRELVRGNWWRCFGVVSGGIIATLPAYFINDLEVLADEVAGGRSDDPFGPSTP
jgi:hypothetical protein